MLSGIVTGRALLARLAALLLCFLDTGTGRMIAPPPPGEAVAGACEVLPELPRPLGWG